MHGLANVKFDNIIAHNINNCFLRKFQCTKVACCVTQEAACGVKIGKLKIGIYLNGDYSNGKWERIRLDRRRHDR